MAYQFIHIETYSEALKQVKGIEGHYNSAAQVLGEAMRVPDYSKHLDEPGKVWRLGGTMSVSALQAKRAARLTWYTETVTRKDGSTYERKLRKDAATLYTEIHSHPLPAEDYRNAPGRHHPDIEKWFGLAIADFKARMPAGVDWAAVMHLDESQVHFHILAINTPDPKLDANKLHAGKAAAAKLRAELDQPTALVSLPKPKLEKRPNKPKQPRPSKNRETQRKNKIKRETQLAAWEKKCHEVEARNADLMKEWEAKNGAYLKAARKQRGAIPEKEAYIAAMTALQDRYYEQVGKLCGLLRDGPRKERLSTVQYGQRKQSARKLKNELDQAASARNQAEETADHALHIKETYQMKANALTAEKAEFDEGIAAIEEMANQLNNGQAYFDGDQIEMLNPPAFLKRLFGPRSSNTKVSGLFRKLVGLIGRAAGRDRKNHDHTPRP